MDKDVEIFQIHCGYVNGYHLRSKNKIQKGVVVTFGGSEGGCYYDMAEHIAQNGFEVLALYYFGKYNQPSTLSNVPIEFFSEIINYIDQYCISQKPLTVIAASRGAELAGVLAEYYSEINNLILFAPSAYRFQGANCFCELPAWTYNEEALPYIHSNSASIWEKNKLSIQCVLHLPIRQLSYNDSTIKNTMDLEKTRIKFELFKGRVLIFLGQDDGLWNSDRMSKVIQSEFHKQENFKIIAYPNVGHAFSEGRISGKYFIGGSKEANLAALKDSNQKVIEALLTWHV